MKINVTVTIDTSIEKYEERAVKTLTDAVSGLNGQIASTTFAVSGVSGVEKAGVSGVKKAK